MRKGACRAWVCNGGMESEREALQGPGLVREREVSRRQRQVVGGDLESESVRE